MHRQIDFRSILKLAQSTQVDRAATPRQRHQQIAELCKLIGETLVGKKTPKKPPTPAIETPLPHLAPRVRETLMHLLKGDSEKQIARKLNLSKHTVHVYVKTLYREMSVSSRGELLARFVHPPQGRVR